MGTGQQRINQLGDIEFAGAVGKRVAQYAKTTQQLGHDLAYEFDERAGQATKAIRKLRGHPALLGVDVYMRARWVTRRLRRASELARGVSAEAVKFNLQYRREFLDIQDAGTKPTSRNSRFPFAGEVDL